MGSLLQVESEGAGFDAGVRKDIETSLSTWGTYCEYLVRRLKRDAPKVAELHFLDRLDYRAFSTPDVGGNVRSRLHDLPASRPWALPAMAMVPVTPILPMMPVAVTMDEIMVMAMMKKVEIAEIVVTVVVRMVDEGTTMRMRAGDNSRWARGLSRHDLFRLRAWFRHSWFGRWVGHNGGRIKCPYPDEENGTPET